MENQLTFLKSRARLCFCLFLKHQTAAWLWRWFEAEVNVVQAEGFVDTHPFVFVSRDTTTDSVAMVLANSLRLRRLGECKPVLVD